MLMCMVMHDNQLCKSLTAHVGCSASFRSLGGPGDEAGVGEGPRDGHVYCGKAAIEFRIPPPELTMHIW